MYWHNAYSSFWPTYFYKYSLSLNNYTRSAAVPAKKITLFPIPHNVGVASCRFLGIAGPKYKIRTCLLYSQASIFRPRDEVLIEAMILREMTLI